MQDFLHEFNRNQIVFWIIAGALTALTVSLLTRGLGRRLSLAITLLVPLAVLPLYLTLGRPELTAWHTRPALPPFIASAVDKLKTDTAEHPDDVQAWVLLGGVYRKQANYDEAADAYRHALALQPYNAMLKASLGEMIVMQAGGRVTADALALFHQANDEPASRYYLAQAKAQAGDWNGALADWQALLSNSADDAPWHDATAARISDADLALGKTR